MNEHEDTAMELGADLDNEKPNPAVAVAVDLRSQITAASKNKDFRTLLALNAQPDTRQLLVLLPEAVASDALTHLDDAVVWRSIQEEANSRRIKKANGALADFDLGLTRALARKVDPEFLTETDRTAYDELLLGITTRSMEMDQVLDAAGPLDLPEDEPPRRRWWKRK